MEKRHGFTVLRLLLLGAAVLASFLLPRSAAGAAKHWHAAAHPPVTGAGAPAPHAFAAGLPPLSAPPPTAGADDLPPSQAPGGQRQQPAPHFGFPLQPGPGAAAGPAGAVPGAEGYPFIGSNPTVPLPTGMTDTSTTVLPLPDTAAGEGDAATTKVVGLAASVPAPVVSMIGLIGVFFATLFMFLSKI